MCPNGKNRTLFLIMSSIFLISSLCFGAVAYVGQTNNIILLNDKNKDDCNRGKVRKLQKEIKNRLRKMENRIIIERNTNDSTKQ